MPIAGLLPPAELMRISTCPSAARAASARRLRRAFGHHVDLDDRGLGTARGRDLGGERFEQLAAPRRDRDLRAFGGEAFRDRAADAHARAGHERRLVFQLQIHVPPKRAPIRQRLVALAFNQVFHAIQSLRTGVSAVRRVSTREPSLTISSSSVR